LKFQAIAQKTKKILLDIFPHPDVHLGRCVWKQAKWAASEKFVLVAYSSSVRYSCMVLLCF